MEKGHVAILEGIRDQDIEKIDIPEIEDLQISEYIVHDEPSVELSYQDLLHHLFVEPGNRMGNETHLCGLEYEKSGCRSRVIQEVISSLDPAVQVLLVLIKVEELGLFEPLLRSGNKLHDVLFCLSSAAQNIIFLVQGISNKKCSC